MFGRKQACLLSCDKFSHEAFCILLKRGIDLMFGMQQRGKRDIQQFMSHSQRTFLKVIGRSNLVNNSQCIPFLSTETMGEQTELLGKAHTYQSRQPHWP